jgi:hypothetical protein
MAKRALAGFNLLILERSAMSCLDFAVPRVSCNFQPGKSRRIVAPSHPSCFQDQPNGSLFARARPRCAAKNGEGSNMTDSLTKRDQPDRSKINMNEVHYWTKHLSKEELQKAIDNVGNSAAAVRKELAV